MGLIIETIKETKIPNLSNKKKLELAANLERVMNEILERSLIHAFHSAKGTDTENEKLKKAMQIARRTFTTNI
jgi:hypothetical protein